MYRRYNLSAFNGTSSSDNFYVLKPNNEVYLNIHHITDKEYVANGTYNITDFPTRYYPHGTRELVAYALTPNNTVVEVLLTFVATSGGAWTISVVPRGGNVPSGSLIVYTGTYLSESTNISQN